MKVGQTIRYNGRAGIIAQLPEYSTAHAICWFGNEFHRETELVSIEMLETVDCDDLGYQESVSCLGMAQLLIDKVIDDKKIF